MSKAQIITRVCIAVVIALVATLMVYGLTLLKPKPETVAALNDEIIVNNPRIHIRSVTQHHTLQTWIVSDEVTGCDFLLVRDGPAYTGGPMALTMNLIPGSCHDTKDREIH